MPPPGEPKRYVRKTGYVELVWRTDTEYVRTYEHRVVAGAEAHEHVHHIDHDKSNNEPSNLQVMLPSGHARLHNETIDVETARYLRERGYSIKRIAAFLECDNGALSRALHREREPT